MSVIIVWTLVVVFCAITLLAIIWINGKLDSMRLDIEGLESAFIEEVLDAVDSLVWPLSDYDRELVRDRVMGER